MNKYAEARETLTAALEEVLPGRVFPYEPEDGLPLAVWLGVALPRQRQAATGATVKAVALPVVITFDGSIRAQVAGLDEVVSKVEDAIEALPGARLVAATFVDSPADRSLSSVVLDVDLSVGVRSFCAPTVLEAAVPPPIVQSAA